MMRGGLLDQLQTNLHVVRMEVAELTTPEWPNILHMTGHIPIRYPACL
jgi:hypothetical protein